MSWQQLFITAAAAMMQEGRMSSSSCKALSHAKAPRRRSTCTQEQHMQAGAHGCLAFTQQQCQWTGLGQLCAPPAALVHAHLLRQHHLQETDRLPLRGAACCPVNQGQQQLSSVTKDPAVCTAVCVAGARRALRGCAAAASASARLEVISSSMAAANPASEASAPLLPALEPATLMVTGGGLVCCRN
jgi:hypothetical protein